MEPRGKHASPPPSQPGVRESILQPSPKEETVSETVAPGWPVTWQKQELRQPDVRVRWPRG